MVGIYNARRGASILPKNLESLGDFCERVGFAKGCLLKEADNCPDKAKSYLQATIEGLEMASGELCNEKRLETRARKFLNSLNET